MDKNVKLLSIATAVPEHIIQQSDAAETAARLFSDRFQDFRHLASVFTNAGIRTRHATRPLDWFAEPHGWEDRMSAYVDMARRLFAEAAAKALADADLAAEDVDCIVTVSSTGLATPSLDAQLARQMGFRADIERVPVFGLGCAAGVSGLAVAARLVRNRPGATVLFVAIELCTLAFRLDELTRANIIATALFADGAAACVLRNGGNDGLIEIEATGEHLFPDTLGIMGWKVDDGGFGVVLAQSLPPFVEAELGGALDAILDRNGLSRDDIGRFICHPGGTRVLAALETVLCLPTGTLDVEREVLAEYGNMSSPTVLFVLERALRQGLPERSAMLAMGPGFSASCMTLRRVA
ncbi:type III polyketide synthase [Rhizobium sp. BG6]|uniref:type III polyketide synthase n=1 Tax=Rhizobium sp. BG6 TaxID=2613771 RepID=UPI00193D9CB9|nr:3-oxoacyl-[acyl-carrier-protein] synthase III C-terminal domain-containing protein [Rhizobium sp. BG6]QRM48338.1 type III polyketide synthase [Rhizobium sp. BG6]